MVIIMSYVEYRLIVVLNGDKRRVIPGLKYEASLCGFSSIKSI